MWYKRISAQEVGPDGPTYLSVWIFFQIAAGHIVLPILATTMIFAKSVKKQVPLINACMTWIIAAVCSSLLFYVGQYRGSEPNSNLCIGQASLVGAIPILTCTATLLLAYYLRRTYDDSDVPELAARQKRVATFSQLIIPYAVFGIFVAVGVMLSVYHADRVNREQRFFYCSLNWKPLTYAIEIIATILCAVAFAFEAHNLSISIRYWKLLRRGGHLIDESVVLSLRTFSFTLYLLASTIINLTSNWVDMSVAPDLISASVGMVFFLIFVSQKEIICAWCFWRRPSRIPPPGPQSPREPLVPVLTASGNARDALDADRGSKDTYSSSMLMRDYYESKAKGVEVIGRPDEAFSHLGRPYV